MERNLFLQILTSVQVTHVTTVLCALTYKINTRARVQEVGKAHTVNKVMYFVELTFEKPFVYFHNVYRTFYTKQNDCLGFDI